MESYRAAALEEDIDGVFAHFTEDIQVLEPGLAAGGNELRTIVRGMLEGADVTRFEFERHDIFVHDGAAYEMGSYDEVIVADGEETVIEGHAFLRWERGEDGRWRMDRLVAGPRNAPEGI